MAIGRKGRAERSAHSRFPLMGAALLIWIAVVVVGAGRSGDDSLLGVENLEIVWAILMGLATLFGLAVLIMVNPFREFKEPVRGPRTGMAAALFFMLIVLLWRPNLLDDFVPEQPEEGELAGVVEASTEPIESGEQPVQPVAQATDLLLIAGAVLGIGGVVYLMRTRDAEDLGAQATADEQLETELFRAIEEASSVLATGSDPRTAVLNAYAALESVLAQHGSVRAAAETPTEHLRRSLRRLRVNPAPLMQLGELYEVARFSTRPIGVAEQRGAAAALDRARAEFAQLS